MAGLARMYETYLVVQCKARWPEVMPDRYFNTLFVISPAGDIVHKAAKNHLWCRERSCTPHDVYDRWVELFGDGIDAFFPVLRTDDIGNLGTICCTDGEYPEAVRALAFNGAEVVYRPSEAVPMTNVGYPGGGTWMLQNRAHAHFNNVYMIAPNVGPVYLHPKMQHPFDIAGGQLAHRRLHGERPVVLAVRRQHVRHGDRRHRGAASVPGHEPQLELDEGPPHRGVPAHVRGTDPPEEPLDVAGADLAQVIDELYRREHQPADRARRVHGAGQRVRGRQVLPDGRPAIPRRGVVGGPAPLGRAG